MTTKSKGLFSGFYLLLFSGMGVFTTVLPIYLHDLGLNKQAIGIVMAAGPIAAIIAPPLWGYTADRMQNKQRVLALCLAGTLVSSLLLNQFPVTWLLFISYFVYNFFQSGTSPIADSLVICSLGSRCYGNIRLWGSIGFAGGALLCGEVLGFVHSSRLLLLYFIMGLFTLLFTTLLPTETVKTSSGELFMRDVYNLISKRQFLLVMVIVFLVIAPYGAYSSFLGLYLKEIGATPFQIGLAWMIAALAEVPLFAWGGGWIRPHRAWSLLGLGAIIFGLRWLAYGMWGNPTTILLLQLLQCLSFGLFFLVSVQLVNWLSPKELKAVGQTVFSSVSFGLSFAVGNFLGGYLANAYGLGVMFIWAGLLALTGGVIALVANVIKVEVYEYAVIHRD